jgi:hypothetical protein
VLEALLPLCRAGSLQSPSGRNERSSIQVACIMDLDTVVFLSAQFTRLRACANSCTLAKRSLGSPARAFSTTCSTPGETAEATRSNSFVVAAMAVIGCYGRNHKISLPPKAAHMSPITSRPNSPCGSAHRPSSG